MQRHENTLSEKQLEIFEHKLAGIIAKLGYLKGRSAKTSAIMAHIYIRQQATQQLLRELTGFSLGTVSSSLQELEKLNVVSKHANPNERGYIYRLIKGPSQTMPTSMTDFQEYLSQTRCFLEKTEVKLKKYSLTKAEGYNRLKNFLDDMNILIPAYQQILRRFLGTSIDTQHTKQTSQLLTSIATSKPALKADKEILIIEKEIVNFLSSKNSEYSGRDPIIAKVMTYFYVRKNLTQKELRKLTGFSAGAISKALRQLVETNFITREIIPGTHTHIYKMEMLPFRSPRFFLTTEKLILEIENELKEMKAELEAFSEEKKQREVYKRIYGVVTQLLELLSRIPAFIDLIEVELKNYIKNGGENN